MPIDLSRLSLASSNHRQHTAAERQAILAGLEASPAPSDGERLEMSRELAGSLHPDIFDAQGASPAPEQLAGALAIFHRAAAAPGAGPDKELLQTRVEQAECSLMERLGRSRGENSPHLLSLLGLFGSTEATRQAAFAQRSEVWRQNSPPAPARFRTYPEAVMEGARFVLLAKHLEPIDPMHGNWYVSLATPQGRLCLAPSVNVIGNSRVHASLLGNRLATAYVQYRLPTADPWLARLAAQHPDASKQPPAVPAPAANKEDASFELLYPRLWDLVRLGPVSIRLGPYIPATLATLAESTLDPSLRLAASGLLMRDVAESCIKIGQADMVCRALYPDNIGISRVGSGQLLSLSSLQKVGPGAEAGPAQLPTWLWPPEILGGQPFAAAAEAWTLGVTLLAGANFRLFVGHTPEQHREELTAFAQDYTPLCLQLANNHHLVPPRPAAYPYRDALYAAAHADQALTQQVLAWLLHPEPEQRANILTFYAWTHTWQPQARGHDGAAVRRAIQNWMGSPPPHVDFLPKFAFRVANTMPIPARRPAQPRW